MSKSVKASTEVLQETEFWLYYQKGDDQSGIDQRLLDAYFQYTRNEEGEVFCDPLQIPLKCLEYSFVLDIYVDFYAINAAFSVPGDKTEYQIGWWDFSHWHPFGLRWEELIRLWEYWKSNPDQLTVTADQALLLLAKFVGTGQSEITKVPERKQFIKSAYQRLGLDFHFKEINELSSCTFLLPSEEDYEWKKDKKLGDLFSGSNPCYSLRNKHHVSGEEGIFPFEPFRKMMKNID